MKFFKYLGICAIMLFSFYYTDKIASFVLEKNKLYQEIDNKKESYKVKSTAAIIDGNYIIPGLMGQEVNVKDSYYNMKSLDAFNEHYLVYESTNPDVSIENNKDKIINKGNPKKNSVSFILENDEELINYFINNNIKANLLVDLDNYKIYPTLELINNDAKNYEKVESLLNNGNLNSNLCILNNTLENLCRENNKYLIEAINVDNSTFLEIKKTIESGNIYLIKKGINIENLKLLIKDIKFKDLKIVYLSELISENNVN